ncbi:MAG: STAS domain-containing protein [Cyanobacteriota bacterium]
MADGFDVKIDKRSDFAILRTDGYVNNLGGEKIGEAADSLMKEGIINLIINFEKSTVVNSIGISILIEVIEKLVDNGGKIIFSNLTKTIAKTFNIMGLTQFAEICETEADAVASISG